MARALHLLKADVPAVAVSAIAAAAAEPGSEVTVVLLDGAPAPPLPAGVDVRRLPGDLDHAGLLELIFEADHVLAW